MIAWPETIIELSSLEEHGIILSFLSRFNKEVKAGICISCNFRYFYEGDDKDDFYTDEHGILHNDPIHKSVDPLDFVSPCILDKFNSLHLLNQIFIIREYYYSYKAPTIAFCDICYSVTLYPAGRCVRKGMYRCYFSGHKDFFCTIYCKGCSIKRNALVYPRFFEMDNTMCAKHKSLFEALYFYIFDQQRLFEYEKRITTYTWKKSRIIRMIDIDP